MSIFNAAFWHKVRRSNAGQKYCLIHSQEGSVAKGGFYAVMDPNGLDEYVCEAQKHSTINCNHAGGGRWVVGGVQRLTGKADLSGGFQKLVSHAQGMTGQVPRGTSRGAREVGGSS